MVVSELQLPMNFGLADLYETSNNNASFKLADGEKFGASSLMLGYHSPVIKEKYIRAGILEIDVEEFSVGSVKTFVEAMYCGRLNITQSNFREVHKMCHVFQVTWMSSKSLQFYEAVLHNAVDQDYDGDIKILFEEAMYLCENGKSGSLMEIWMDVAGKERTNIFIVEFLKSGFHITESTLGTLIALTKDHSIFLEQIRGNISEKQPTLDKISKFLVLNINLRECLGTHPKKMEEVFDILLDNENSPDWRQFVKLYRKTTKGTFEEPGKKKVALADAAVPNLITKFEEEKKELRNSEKQNSHLYMTVEAVTDASFHGFQGNDLLNWEEAQPRPSVYRVKKEIYLGDLKHMIAGKMGLNPLSGLRLWPFESRANSTTRPAPMYSNTDETLWEVAGAGTPLKVFVETIDQSNPAKGLMPWKTDTESIIFLKYFDVPNETMHYLTHVFLSLDSCAGDVFQFARDKMGLQTNVPLALYEEVHAAQTDELTSTKILGEMEDVFDGDIWVVQRTDAQGKFNSVADYFQDLYSRVNVQLCDKSNPGDPGVQVFLKRNMTYSEVAEEVADCTGIQPSHVQFFKPDENHGYIAGYAIKSTFKGTLKDLFYRRSPKKLFYLKLDVTIAEHERKEHFRCTWLNKTREATVLTLCITKPATIKKLFEEAKKHIEMTRDGSGKLRLLEMVDHRIHKVMTSNSKSFRKTERPVFAQPTTYRVEEIPDDETILGPNEFLIPVAHFHGTIFQPFDHPFLFKVTEEESIHSVRTRMMERFKDISKKVFEKYKFVLIMRRGRGPMGVSLADDYTFLPSDFITNGDEPLNEAHLDVSLVSRPWLGLSH